jgi:ACT domain-containing protein
VFIAISSTLPFKRGMNSSNFIKTSNIDINIKSMVRRKPVSCIFDSIRRVALSRNKKKKEKSLVQRIMSEKQISVLIFMMLKRNNWLNISCGGG